MEARDQKGLEEAPQQPGTTPTPALLSKRQGQGDKVHL